MSIAAPIERELTNVGFPVVAGYVYSFGTKYSNYEDDCPIKDTRVADIYTTVGDKLNRSLWENMFTTD